MNMNLLLYGLFVYDQVYKKKGYFRFFSMVGFKYCSKIYSLEIYFVRLFFLEKSFCEGLFSQKII